MSQPPKKTKHSDTNTAKGKKKITSFRTEWLAEFVQVDGENVKLGDVFSFSDERGVICKTCSEAKVQSDFSEGKTWNEWKVDYLKRHLQHKAHQNAAGILRRGKQGIGIGALLQQNAEERCERKEELLKKKSDSQQVRVLIDNVILRIDMNASMLAVQKIHDHIPNT